jgi:2,5-dioxopentanoate dehydrogenase
MHDQKIGTPNSSMETIIEGKQIIGFSESAEGTETFHSVDPATGKSLGFVFRKATFEEADLAAHRAAVAFQIYRKKSGRDKADFLDCIAGQIEGIGEVLIETCCRETALPRPRIEGERTRTTNQLRLFATLLRQGSWIDARIETAAPERKPLPKPDIRYMEIALGPVVVFGASNFPLAFSVAGGDTASALAAGCTVIVKAHSAHPATAELVGKAIARAARECNMPDGVFSLLHGEGTTVGVHLVKHPEVKAVGLTGSYTAGKALFDVAAKRPVPIPVYAEMGSTNPVFILPQAMLQRREQIAQDFSASVTLGVGQFCTNPGLLFHNGEAGRNDFLHALETSFSKLSGGTMLTEGIYHAYQKGVVHHQGVDGVQQLVTASASASGNAAQPVLFKTDSVTFMKHRELAEEIFGPVSVIVESGSKEEMLSIARDLSGHLTATVHGTDEDLLAYKDLIDILEQKVGRVVINGFPTGVEVCQAMVHGGPFPATTDGRSTSVGTAAIYRFTRPVCYQSMPDVLLPDELKNNNPLNIWRTVNGEQTRNTIM